MPNTLQEEILAMNLDQELILVSLRNQDTVRILQNFMFVDRAPLYNLLQIEPTWCTNFLNMFIACLYMFRTTMSPSSGENTVPK